MDFFEIAGQIKGHGTPKLAHAVLEDVWKLYGRLSGVGLESYYRDIETRAKIGSFATTANKPKDWQKRQEKLEELIRRVIIHTTCKEQTGHLKARNSNFHAAIASLPATPVGEYDVIVDYKGLRRPPIGSQFRSHFEWQVQTYAWLRGQMPGVRRVGAGVLIFVNELSPSQTDIEDLQGELQRGEADVVPVNGTQDYYAIHRYSPRNSLPNLTLDFRLRRAIKVIDVSDNLLLNALREIDGVVTQIESSAFVEHNTGNIPSHWQACGGANDCVACDFVHFCPSPYGHREPGDPPKPLPSAPG